MKRKILLASRVIQQREQLQECLLGFLWRQAAVEAEDPPRRGVAEGDDLREPPATQRIVLGLGQCTGERLLASVHVVGAPLGGQLENTGRLVRLGARLEDQQCVVLVVADERVQRLLRALPLAAARSAASRGRRLTAQPRRILSIGLPLASSSTRRAG